MSKQRISEILWKAANEHLWGGAGPHSGRFEHTCNAAAVAEGCGAIPLPITEAERFLWSLGCPNSPTKAFGDIEVGTRQQARYAWLMFASMVAAEMEAKGEL